MSLFNIAKILGTDPLSVGVPTPPKVVYKCSYVSQKTPKKFIAWGPNGWWDIDFPMYLFNLTKIWALMLCLWVCQHLPRGLQKCSYVSQKTPKISVHGALIDAEIL